MFDLKEVIISVTNRCNLDCRMCDIPKEPPRDISGSCCREIIEDAASIGAAAVVFSGGEPLLREDIFDLTSLAKQKGLKVCVTSNGSLIDSDSARRLALAGADVVNISVEGPRRTHDFLRGKGSFDKAVSALQNLRKNNIETTIAATVSRYNYEYLGRIFDIAKQNRVTTVKFQPFNKLFIKNKRRGDAFLLSSGEAEKLTRIVGELEIFARNNGISTNPCAYLRKIPHFLSGQYSKGEACGALWSSCPIDSSGDIYPCWVIKEKDTLIGNVRRRRLAGLWGSARHNAIRETIKKRGCPACMMSCYDGIFGGNNLKDKVSLNAAAVKHQGVSVYLKKWAKRVNFYRHCRNPLSAVTGRLKLALTKRKNPAPVKQARGVDKQKVVEAISFIRKMEQELKGKI